MAKRGGFQRLVCHLLLWVLSFSWGAQADPMDWSESKRVAIRPHAIGCHAFLAPADPVVNDSVGVRISSNRVADFEPEFARAIQEKGREFFVGSHLFVAGVAMNSKRATRQDFTAALHRLGFGAGEIKVHVLSVPTAAVSQMALTMFQRVIERVSHFFPDFARHYQRPLASEVLSGLVSSAVVEALNVVYIYKVLPSLDAHLVVASHVAVLASYAVFKKFINNWLLDPYSNHVEMFIKSALLSFPFVVNYNIFGNFSKIMSFYQERGWGAMLEQFPSEMLNFTATQGLSLFLQTLFYNLVVNKGVRHWENRQDGTEKSAAARTLSNWILVPILSVDAVVLAMASGTGNPLLQMGPMEVNVGHAILAALTVFGSALWIWPKTLDPVLDWYIAFKEMITRLGGWPAKSGENH